MAFPKIELFPEFDRQVGYYGRTLGHPARIRILRFLEEEGSTQVSDLVRLLPLAEGTITEHLKKLRQAGLIHVEVRGLMNYYSPDKAGLRAMHAVQAKLFDELRIDTEE